MEDETGNTKGYEAVKWGLQRKMTLMERNRPESYINITSSKGLTGVFFEDRDSSIRLWR